MADHPTPDDIKIIAQFLAAQSGDSSRWPAFTPEAFRLRRELKNRGGFRLTKTAQLAR
jgi:hypothetical protein